MRLSQKQLSDGLKVFLASLLILIGAIGLILPILPGWAFIFLGLIMLGVIERRHAEQARAWMHRQKRRVRGWFRRRH